MIEKKSLNQFLEKEFENLEDLLVKERINNTSSSKLLDNIRIRFNNLNINYQSKINEVYYNNKEIEELVNQLINLRKSCDDLIESNEKLIEKLSKMKKDFDDYKSEEEATKRKLVNKLNDKILKNGELKDKIEILEKELKNKEEKIDDLMSKNKQLKDELEAEKKEYKDYRLVTSGDIIDLNKEIEELKKLENFITVYFNSVEADINRYAIHCNKRVEFKAIKEKLYSAFPNIGERVNHFFANGQPIDESKNLEKNRLKDGDIILIDKVDTLMMNSL